MKALLIRTGDIATFFFFTSTLRKENREESGTLFFFPIAES